MKEGIDQIYSYRRNFLVIGLTGRTGSGCSKTAEILSKNKEALRIPNIDAFQYAHDNDRRKAKIIIDFVRKNWSPFYLVRIKDIITSFILDHSFDEFCDFLTHNFDSKVDYKNHLKAIETDFNNLHRKVSVLRIPEGNPEEKKAKIADAFRFYTSELHDFTEKIKGALSNTKSEDLYTSVYQLVGDNIRSCGKAINKNGTFNAKHADTIVRKTDKVIKVIRQVAKDRSKPAFIVIDALRNPFEVFFLKERYSAFYLMSINTHDDSRKKRLAKLGFKLHEIERLDKKEYPASLTGTQLYISQNIQKCIELADIHINNTDSKDDNYKNLKRQLGWYYSLMLKPGLITPTSDERIMQLAYSAKLNSGCISRQVGAAITDADYSVKGIGWNNTPQNQVPCLLRNAEDLINGNDPGAYTTYEKEDKQFREFFSNTYQTKTIAEFTKCGHNVSFCFKEVQNNLTGGNNQVHTRSLHAEENAFLQLTKYGGSGIKDGLLFSTASPCELCSKKAYQLGIKRIVYIDPYPGIAEKQILQGGTQNPKVDLFSGAIGKAYFQLYQPLLSYKDEIKQAVGLTFRKQAESGMKEVEESSALKHKLSEALSEITSLKERLSKHGWPDKSANKDG